MARKHHEMKTSSVYALSALCLIAAAWSMSWFVIVGP